MAYYPGAWHTVLQAAKVKYRRHVYLNHAFPERSRHLSTATRLLTNEIARAEEEGTVLDHSKF